MPEAQLDRFLMKITMDYPSLDEEINILERHHTNAALVKLEEIQPVITREELLSLRRLTEKVFVDRTLLQYIALIAHKPVPVKLCIWELLPVLRWLCCRHPKPMLSYRDVTS